MKAKTLTMILGCALAAAAAGDVWTDCTAWYQGGTDKNGDGVFDAGELTDLRHAADPDAATHGGGLRTRQPGASNRVETVVCATSGATLANQRVIYLAQIEGTTDAGKYAVREQDIALPFAATTNEYTMLLRVRMDADQPTNRTFVSLLDFGYSGGNDKYSWSVRYYPETEQFGLLYNNGSNTPTFDALTDEEHPTMRGTWLELAATMQKGKMSLGVRAPWREDFAWNDRTFSFAEGHDIPRNGIIYVGAVTGYDALSTSVTPVRGSFHLMAYWDRVLSADEVAEAFATEGFLESYAHHPAVLKVGDAAYGAEMFAGATTGAVTEVSADLQDIAAFPAGIEAGRAVVIPFRVAETCTNLPQQVRLTAAADSAEGMFALKIDGTALKPIAIRPGGTTLRYAPAALFTEGLHALTLARTDGGTAAVNLSCVEISGSWRIGWIDGANAELGGDLGSTALRTYAVTDLSSNRWKTVRSTASAGRTLSLLATVGASDAARRPFVFRAAPATFPAQSYDLVLTVNGVERFRRLCSPSDNALRASPIEVALPRGTLQAGANDFRFKTEVNADWPSPSQTWLTFDYFALEIGEDPGGLCITLR